MMEGADVVVVDVDVDVVVVVDVVDVVLVVDVDVDVVFGAVVGDPVDDCDPDGDDCEGDEDIAIDGDVVVGAPVNEGVDVDGIGEDVVGDGEDVDVVFDMEQDGSSTNVTSADHLALLQF